MRVAIVSGEGEAEMTCWHQRLAAQAGMDVDTGRIGGQQQGRLASARAAHDLVGHVGVDQAQGPVAPISRPTATKTIAGKRRAAAAPTAG